MALAQFVERVLARLGETPVDLALLPPEAALGSIFTGGAGVAFFLHEAARLRGDDRLLPLARRWCETTRAWAEHSTARQWNDVPFGFVVGEGGLSYVEALLSLREGDRTRVHDAVKRIERAAERLGESGGNSRTELLGGAAGVACATRCLDARLPPTVDYDATRGVLKRVRDRAADMVLERYGAAFELGPDDDLGFAHGIAGELWGLVAVVGADHALVGQRLSELAAVRELDEEGLVYWLPSQASDATAFLGTWCNGMPGHTLLWCEVAKQTRGEAAIELAGLCARSVEVLVNTSPSFCCGLTGQAVALQRYAELSGDEQLAAQASARLVDATRIAEAGEAGEETPLLGVWHGMLGIALVAMGTLHDERVIPCIEPLPPRG